MKTFMGKNFLLTTDTAKELFHDYAENTMFVAFAPMIVAFAPMILLSYSSFECLSHTPYL